MSVHAAITVRRPLDEVYAYWSDFTNLPRFMAHVEQVTVAPDGTSHWRVSGPVGTHVEWDARVVEAVAPRVLRWESVGSADVENSGSVRFAEAPGDQGTEVRVEIDYRAPGGKVGELVARLFGEQPRQQVEDDLRRFKQVLETGDIMRSEGSPEGTRAGNQVRQRTAEPVEQTPEGAVGAG